MYLNKLYSEPHGLFNSGKDENPNVIIFKDGVNFIFGKKVNDEQTKKSLNGIGKSSLLNLIDFCLLSDYNKTRNPRLYKEHDQLKGFKVVLEFQVKSQKYIIKRGFENDKEVEFGKENNSLDIYDTKTLKKVLFDIVFADDKYSGVIDNRWYRMLIGFYVKIHRRKGQLFEEPTSFIRQQNALSLNRILFYLMGVNNRLICENYELYDDVKGEKEALSRIKKHIEKTHKTDIDKVEIKINQKKNDLKKVQDAISSFNLSSEYDNVEITMDKLTVKITDLRAKRYWINKDINTHKESYEIKDLISPNKIAAIKKTYKEINKILAISLSKKLKDAVEFRKSLSESRKAYLGAEINRLEKELGRIDSQIKDLDEQRANLFLFLESKEAFKDLTSAYEIKTKIEADIYEIKSNYDFYKELLESKLNWQTKVNEKALEISDFLKIEEAKTDDFRETFNDVHDKLYPKSKSSGFAVSFSEKKQSKISINITFDDDRSKGKNSGRTLVFDLAILLSSIEDKRSLPRFLIHDGIFDGMDKSQFVEAYHFVNSLLNKGKKYNILLR